MLKVTVFDGRGVRLCSLFDGYQFKCESCGAGTVKPVLGDECWNCGAQVSHVLDLLEGGRMEPKPQVMAAELALAAKVGEK
jgi:hypothetical protein